MKRFTLGLLAALLPWLTLSADALDGIYNLKDYGVSRNGKTLDTRAIQQVIDQCAESGGGTVVLPKGDYLVGTLNLRSNVEFHFEKGARLIATTDLTKYQRHNQELAGVFYTEDAENVSITGEGTIFGQGMAFMHADSLKSMWAPGYRFTRQGESCRRTPDGSLGDGPVEPRDRFHQMLVFSNCRNVRLTDFRCVDSPYWCFIIVHCDGVLIHGLTIDNNQLIPNSDGIDVISTSNVNISDCHFVCGDDALVFTGYDWHFGNPGLKRIHRPMRNINVSNCNFSSRSSGIRIGLWDRNPLMDFNFENVNIYDSNCGIGISVRDSCGLENMNFHNINIRTRLHFGDWWGNGEPIKITAIRDDNFDTNRQRHYVPGTIRNLKFQNINATGESSVLLYASDESTIENITFTDCDFRLRQSALEAIGGGNFDMRPNSVDELQFFQHDTPVIYARNIRGLQFTRVRTSLEGVITVPYIKDGIVLEDMKEEVAADPVKQWGQLQVKDAQLCDQQGRPVVLRGVSLGWHNLWPRFYNKKTIKWLKDDWHPTVIRAAIGASNVDDHYGENPEFALSCLYPVVDAAIKQNLYVIIDWHSHKLQKEAAVDFFGKMAQKYGKYPNVIYEIFNEPEYDSWEDIKEYAKAVITEIRRYDPDNIILVGCPHWDQDIHLVADSPLQGFTNIMYTVHFYAATHKQDLRDRMTEAVGRGIPVFISECAGMEASGDGPVNQEEWNAWVDCLERQKVSYVCWSVSDKNETCSMLLPRAKVTGWTDDLIKPWGKTVKSTLKKYNK